MRSFFAIFKQTLRASIRSRVFHILIGFILLAVFLLPLTVTSDGTASGELKLSLTYSFTTVTVLLSLATVWLGCIGLSHEIESYQIHMVMTKPAAGWLVWLGKWLAVFTMNAMVFLLAAGLMYTFIMLRFHYGDYSEEQRAAARQEVLVGRRTYAPDKPDFAALAQRRYEEMKDAGRLDPDHDPAQTIAELKRQFRARSTEVPAGAPRVWRFTGLKEPGGEERIAMRYRLYVGSTRQSAQRMTNGVWVFTNPELPEERRSAILPQRVNSGSFHEITFPAEFIAGTEEIYLQYSNLDPGRQSVIFQPEDGPLLLVAAAGFTTNWLRACLMILMQLAALAALGCFFGAAFSPPVAVFAALSCLILGAAASPDIGEPMRGSQGQIMSWPVADMLAHSVAVTLDKTMVTLDASRLAFKLAQGRLIDTVDIAKALVFELFLKGGVMAALGAWVLSRRELGKVMRQ